ncbi:translation initiation factor IF-2-like [Orcinus orca]|uniref:translation initiation factor IF-2-like n=1 Tax=Orcinus orca TaxID=9733 RepID=UPI0021134129|nr:translation initiation factor IF-2-like [Orcinus orca]
MRVRGWRTLHRGPRAAHGRSGVGVLRPSAGSRLRERNTRLKRRRRARPELTHPPRPARLRRVRPRETTSAARGARAPPRPPAPRRAAPAPQPATARGNEAPRDGGRAAAPHGLCGLPRRAVSPGASGRPPPAPGCAALGLRQPGRLRQGQCPPGGGGPGEASAGNAAAPSPARTVAQRKHSAARTCLERGHSKDPIELSAMAATRAFWTPVSRDQPERRATILAEVIDPDQQEKAFPPVSCKSSLILVSTSWT